MEALLLYRTGTTVQQLKADLKNESIQVRDVLWTPTLNFEDLVWGIKTICIVADRDKKMFAVARHIKKVFPYVNIFMFVDSFAEDSKALKTSKVICDVFDKPFEIGRISRIIKSHIINEGETAGFDVCQHLSLDLNKRSVCCDSAIVPLRNKEFELLQFLILNRGRLVSRTMLIDHVWDRNTKISSNTLDVHIGRLRKKLEEPFKNKFIHTVHSIGYRFDCN